MRLMLTALILSPAPALAHIGHLGEVAGHGHWIALGGIAIAGVIAALGKRKKPEQAEPEDDAPEGEEELA